MAFAYSQQSFLGTTIHPLTSPLYTPNGLYQPKHLLSFRSSSDKRGLSSQFGSVEAADDVDKGKTNNLAKLAIVTLAAGVLTLGSVSDAMAAKSSGRVGGQAFRSAAPKASSPTPRRSNPRTNNNIYINPPIAPPLFGGYGYGYGWSPFSFFAPGPTLAIGGGGGILDFIFFFFALSFIANVVRNFIRSRDRDDDGEDY
ncbi:hypothetical protein ZOSMA_169G00510 [Zostera marina]|uniref:Transmembrane protein n=1 Tax=Zostera marina TaxID=29655 RepID=A0A0K9PTH9_ZOSMR|nr:hypothetical protein ZOSMA_169G00510 [Zostera marina]